jgi:hypothetical protein
MFFSGGYSRCPETGTGEDETKKLLKRSGDVKVKETDSRRGVEKGGGEPLYCDERRKAGYTRVRPHFFE